LAFTVFEIAGIARHFTEWARPSQAAEGIDGDLIFGQGNLCAVCCAPPSTFTVCQCVVQADGAVQLSNVEESRAFRIFVPSHSGQDVEV
jgi:hypothetical protein